MTITRREEFDGFLRHVDGRARVTESQIEHLLRYSIEKHLLQGDFPILPHEPVGTTYGARLVPQVDIKTRCGSFRMDFVLHSSGLNTLIECDGEAFHIDPFDDELRSALILETGLIDQVIRFNGTMLYHAPDDGAFFTRRVHPAAFASNAETVLAIKATPEAREAAAEAAGQAFRIWYDAEVQPDAMDFDMDGNVLTRPAGFRLRYHHRESPDGRIAELLAVLAASDPHTVQELERLYWATVKNRTSELAVRVRADVRRQQDAESGSLTRALFDAEWDVLIDRFQGTPGKRDPEMYFRDLSTLYVAQFMRACATAFRNDDFFPTVDRLRFLALDNSDLVEKVQQQLW